MPKSMFIPCTIERGAFSNERIFKIKLPAGKGSLFGTANVRYLRDEEKKPIQEAPTFGEMQGYVRCHVIKNLNDGTVAVEVPSTDTIHVPADELVALD